MGGVAPWGVALTSEGGDAKRGSYGGNEFKLVDHYCLNHYFVNEIVVFALETAHKILWGGVD